MAFEDLFRRQFSRPLPMSYYDPQFGEEELASVMAARQGLVGRTEIPVGPTGLYGRALASVGAREAARSAAVGDLLSRARGQRMRAREAAHVKRIQEDAAAERAGRLQQARLRGNVMAGIGEVGGSVGDLLSDPLFQKRLKGLAEGPKPFMSMEEGRVFDEAALAAGSEMGGRLSDVYTNAFGGF